MNEADETQQMLSNFYCCLARLADLTLCMVYELLFRRYFSATFDVLYIFRRDWQ